MNSPPDAKAPAAAPAVPQLLVAAQSALWAHAQQLAPGWLTESEQARLATMQHPQRRQEFVACRYALRSLLAQATATPVEHWRLDAPEGRAPALSEHHHGVPAAAPMHLSLSHSETFVACALAVQPVGVDIEVQSLRSPRRDVLALATLACSDYELQQLRATDCELSRQRMFVQWWSLKEAYFKCLGTGVDFSYIQRIECRRTAGRVVRPLAYAVSWSGKTQQLGRDAVLSVCALERSSHLYAFLADEAIEWHGEAEWSLVEC